MDSYTQFLLSKRAVKGSAGIDAPVEKLPDWLKPFQKVIVSHLLAIAKGAAWTATGTGKTRMQLAVAQEVVKTTGKPYLILCPLAVAAQTVREAELCGLKATRIEDASGVTGHGIYVCNYDRLSKLDCTVFGGVSLDESGILKNYTGATKCALVDAFAETEYRHAFTWTPAPNDFMELGNHAEFLGIMPSSEMLMRWFINDTAHVGHYRLKGHAEDDFWQWIASWAVCMEKPSDLGFDDEGYILPTLHLERSIVETEVDQRDTLVPDAALSATSMHREMRRTADARAVRVAEIVAEKPEEQWLIWCNTDYEAVELRRRLPNAKEVSSKTKPEERERLLLGFSAGKVQILITKPSIAGFGMNWQRCHNMVFIGLSYSFEQLFQAIRRCWRFGQLHEVYAWVVLADSEWSLAEAIDAKQARHEKQISEMVKVIKERGIGASSERREMAIDFDAREESGANWKYMLGDSCERIAEVDNDSVGLTVFSPPFSNLYTYSASLRDMGNTVNHAHFFEHFRFLLPELLRVTMPGRLCCVHCKDLPTYRGRDGASGLWDFPGELIREFEAAGWQFHSRVTIWKCPVTERERTNNNGLLHKTVKRDSSQIRQGMADYLIVFRKTPIESNLSAEPIARESGFEDFIGDSELDPRTYHAHPSPYARLGGENPNLAIWRRYAEPVWWDIDQTDVLNVEIARDDKDEKHICPLQLGLIRRCVQMWSNPGDVVFSPFGGIASEPAVAVEEGRYGLAIELKELYWLKGINNLRGAEARGRGQLKLELEAA